MSEQKSDRQWHAEQARAERKARLSRMKDKNGGKKPVRTGNPAFKIVGIILLVLAVLAAGGWYVLNSSLPQQTLAAMTINGDKIKVAELNYYFYMTASSYGIDMTDPKTAEASLATPSSVEGYATYRDLILEAAARQVQENYMLASEATKAGLSLDDSDRAKISEFYKTLQAQAESENMTLTNFMAKYFGKGATQETLTPAFERLLLAQKFARQKKTATVISDADIEKYYNEHKNDYDVVTYRAFTFKSDAADTATDAEKTTAAAAAHTKAEAMATLVSDEESFKAQALANATADEKNTYATSDASLVTNARYSGISSLPQSQWLFDSARKAGDKTVVDETGSAGSTVLYFLSRSIDNQPRVNVRHILIRADEASATDAELAAAKAKAEEILAQYRAGAQTEEAFAELARANSADSNASDGGLYTNIYPGQMVDTFNAWIFDKSRQPGDTGIVQSNYGYHVMYFVGQAGEEWKINIHDVLAEQAYDAYLKDLKASYPYEMNSLGLRFVP